MPAQQKGEIFSIFNVTSGSGAEFQIQFLAILAADQE
jgi:hypothetical protein